MSKSDFYRAFEERYYAPREIIRELRKQYIPFIEPFKEKYKNSNTFDLGCGRGEWLELMQENGFQPYGVDLDDGMLKACSERNLPASKGNAIDYIKTIETESQIIVTAFHVVEHISFEDLQLFIQETLRVLTPGGILIMETPNPENIKVATENFYLDPTHIKPIPAGLLSFLPEFYGYARTKVVRLQESKDLVNQENVNLLQVIEGASPDYAVIAQKKANEDILKPFNELFKKDFGLSLNFLAGKFETRLLNIEAKASQAEARASQAEVKATQAEVKATQAEVKATQAEAKASQAEAKASQAEAKATQAEANFITVVGSRSWKVTKPLRFISKALQWFLERSKAWLTFAPTSRPRRVLKHLFLWLRLRINTHPKLKKKLMVILNHFPELKDRLKMVAHVNYLARSMVFEIDGSEQLSSQAKKNYNDLKKAIEAQKGKR